MSRFQFRFPSLPHGLNAAFAVPFTSLGLHIYWDVLRSGCWTIRQGNGGEVMLGRVAVVWGFDVPVTQGVTWDLCGHAGEALHG